jgi:hypothetical protein
MGRLKSQEKWLRPKKFKTCCKKKPPLSIQVVNPAMTICTAMVPTNKAVTRPMISMYRSIRRSFRGRT